MEEQKIGLIRSCALDGLDAFIVDVEASFTKGLPNFSIVGMGDESIKESKERIKSALLVNGFSFPPLRITLSLSPADKAKRGSHFDLAMAVLIAMHEQKPKLDEFFCFGEISLDGKLRGTDSMFAMILSLVTQERDIQVLVPNDIANKVAAIFGVKVFGVDTLQEAIEFFSNETTKEPIAPIDLDYDFLDLDQKYYYQRHYELDFKDVRGQKIALRAATISAAGFHNILLSGSAGAGKSMICKRIRYILPPMSLDDILFCAKINSLSDDELSLTPTRPFRAPHHSSTKASIFGGGTRGAKIGEIALASRGELFFDELPHFGKTTLEAMREPLEDKRMLISRVHSKIWYETDFLFAAAMNPCPCGNLLSETKQCRCSDLEIARYKTHLSEPFLDRIDLFVEVKEANLHSKSSTNSHDMHSLVLKAFEAQKIRKQPCFNARIDDKDLDVFCPLDEQTNELLQKAMKSFNLSLRSLSKVRKIARTIADLGGFKNISKDHIIEALSYRKR